MSFALFLTGAPSENIFKYVDGCLARSFPKSGQVLQDLINELGRRLDYDVENGLYQGRPKLIGFDGLWSGIDGHALVVEVKTTDAYRINLDTIAAYREALVANGKITKASSILIVVGRSDTGDFEQQVRGSKHGWDVRLISADALVNLVKIKEASNDDDIISKIQQILKSIEYTRLDSLVDIVFSATKDASLRAIEPPSDTITDTKEKKSNNIDENIESIIKNRIINIFRSNFSVELIKKSRALYWSPDRSFRVVCAISKPYERGDYWYAYHPQWRDFLADGKQAKFVLAFKDREFAYFIPYGFIEQFLRDLYTTTREDGKMYWHLEILANGADKLCLFVRKKQERVSLEPYRVALGA